MLTVETIEAAYRNEEWEGFGYLGERRDRDAGLVAAADEKALAAANAAGMDEARFFIWLNSKLGRWFGDCMFGAAGQHADRYAPGAQF